MSPFEKQNSEKQTGDAPDFKGNGADVWINKTKSGEDYLSISILDGWIRIKAFKFEARK